MDNAQTARLRVRRRMLKACDLPDDPFAGTKLDYAYNLVAAAVLRPGKHSLGNVALIARLLAGSATRSLSDDAAAKRLRALVAQTRGRRRVPRPPAQPTADNLAVIANLLQLDPPAVAVLQFALACQDGDMRELLDPIVCPTRRDVALALAAATGQAVADIDTALAPDGRLPKSGLLTLHNHGELDERLELDHRLVNVLTVERLSADAVMDRFLPAAAAPTLVPEDYGHLQRQVELARQLLAAALGPAGGAARPGTNLLLVGPTGTGKTELARLLAAQLGAPLFIAGRQDDDGESPTAQDRLRSLLLGNRLLASSRALLMFDEMEDLFTGVPVRRHRHNDARLSKQWFNHLLETNAVPTIWISNDVDDVDRAFLRRFTFAIEVGAPTATQRRRAWNKHLGNDAELPGAELDRLVARFEVSPAQIGSAVSAARLAAGGGQLSGPLLEAVLAPSDRILGGRRRPGAGDTGPYLPAVVNTPVDLEALTERLRQWDRDRAEDGPGVALCLYGPPGTGKSAYVGHLAQRLDRPLLVRRPSDLLGAFIGETEKAIAAAFERARDERAVLLLDEADTFLQDRRMATRSWEVSQVNELLQQLESFPGVVAATTNLMRELDQASLRRFAFKIPFDYLRADQAERLLRAALARLGQAEERASGPEVEAAVAEVRALARLTPGDFAAVARRVAVMGAGAVTAMGVVRELREEVRVKGAATGRVGF